MSAAGIQHAVGFALAWRLKTRRTGSSARCWSVRLSMPRPCWVAMIFYGCPYAPVIASVFLSAHGSAVGRRKRPAGLGVGDPDGIGAVESATSVSSRTALRIINPTGPAWLGDRKSREPWQGAAGSGGLPECPVDFLATASGPDRRKLRGNKCGLQLFSRRVSPRR